MNFSATEKPESYTPLLTYRYERKYVVEELTLPQIKAVIKAHPKLFYQAYPPRYINSLYLDTIELENYYDNVQGSAERRKMRVRWYGELRGRIKNPILEIKIKNGLVGKKLSFSLDDFDFTPTFNDHTLYSLFDKKLVPEIIRYELKTMNAVLLNRYYRHYYVSRDGAYRVTIDNNLSFYRINCTCLNQLAHRQLNCRELVVELKYGENDELFSDRVSGFFPFRMTRSSKYVQGIERVYF
jgi:hypothetical protein